jgi:hypothetical protein
MTTMSKSRRRALAQARAAAARAERADRQAAMLTAHADHSARVQQYARALARWLDHGQIGPMPVHPDYVTPIRRAA